MNEEIKEEDLKESSFIKKNYKKILLITSGILLSIYIGGFFYFNGKFLSQTTINGIDVSSLSIAQVHDKLTDQINNNILVLTFIDNQKETIEKGESGISYNKDNHIQDLYDNQNHWLWFMSFFQKSSLKLENMIHVDDTLLTKTLNNLNHLQPEAQIALEDAKVIYKDNGFSIIKEKNGSTINKDNLKQSIQKAYMSGKNEINVLEENGYVLPKITEESQSLKSLLENANKYANASLTYETISGNVTLDGNDIMQWLSCDDEGNYYKDDKVFEQKATEFVKTLKSKINNIGTTRTFTLANNRKVTVSGGNYGLKLKEKDEVKGLLKDINESKKGIRKPSTSGVQASLSNNGLGNTFVEVDLSQQKVYLVKNGKVTLSSSCVTGKYTDLDRRTPAGTYYLYGKQRNRVLRGTRLPDGSWPYESPVSYWMPFNRGIGLHDADWRNQFGGNIYYNNGSHGCINLPVSFAGQLYNSIYVNIPVVCHY